MPPLDGVKVLIVEDHRDTLEMLCVVLGHQGAQTDCTLTIDDALSAARGARPDILVADLQMADNGIQLVSEIRRLVGPVPALIISAHARTQDRDRAMNAGADAFLTKPVDPDEVIGAVARLTGRARRSG